MAIVEGNGREALVSGDHSRVIRGHRDAISPQCLHLSRKAGGVLWRYSVVAQDHAFAGSEACRALQGLPQCSRKKVAGADPQAYDSGDCAIHSLVSPARDQNGASICARHIKVLGVAERFRLSPFLVESDSLFRRGSLPDEDSSWPEPTDSEPGLQDAIRSMTTFLRGRVRTTICLANRNCSSAALHQPSTVRSSHTRSRRTSDAVSPVLWYTA